MPVAHMVRGCPLCSRFPALFHTNSDFFVYAAKIKKVCDTELGIVSQCCQPKKASKLSPQYLENVALKINVKVGI